MFAAFGKSQVWLLVLVYLGLTTCTYGVGLWLPSLIRDVSGVSNMIIGLLSTIPYIATAIAMVVIGIHSDQTHERRWHLAGPALAGAISLAIAAYSTSISASIVFLSLTLMAGYSMLGPFGNFNRAAERDFGRGRDRVNQLLRKSRRVSRAVHHWLGTNLDGRISRRTLIRSCGLGS